MSRLENNKVVNFVDQNRFEKILNIIVEYCLKLR